MFLVCVTSSPAPNLLYPITTGKLFHTSLMHRHIWHFPHPLTALAPTHTSPPGPQPRTQVLSPALMHPLHKCTLLDAFLGFSPCTQTPCGPLHPHVTTPPTHLQTPTAAPTHPVCTHLHPAASHIKHPESSPNVDAVKIHALCKYSQTCSPLFPDGQRQPQPSQGHQ